ncbi:ribosomal protein S18-alanine N-acetyltransferase [Suttonella sp. R2A3]|uniref:ribosomal protein S18-alanine N-acetyltransferase n=1 Tax=Suttonella sp. R2A3 TaxID=2908648 RepID=UPI001F16EE77|nr:ribosomal protein S18-alanine N-acetyltransferase [Suttonella sp. R2A3]UJF25012.1 ribosomal protein S18-alanine N-acetyltransferase [Suttonella sp. R2A3]
MISTQQLGAVQALAQAVNVYQPSADDIAQIDGLFDQQKLIAFACWQVVCDEATLLSIAVDEVYQRLGYGKKVLAHSEQRLVASGITQFFLEVRESNLAAQRLYENLGYQEIARRRDYYPIANGREDAIIMKKEC